MRAARLRVELEAGEHPDLPVGLDAAASRIVQEARTNVIKHGAGAASVQMLVTTSSTSSSVSG